MRKFLFWPIIFLLLSCSKDTEIKPQSKTFLKLSFYDEFTSSTLDSVNFSIADQNKTYTFTRNNAVITDLPKGVTLARISKKGFVTQDYKVDFSNRDTIFDNIILAYDDFILDIPQDSLFASHNAKKYSFEVRRNSGFKINKPDWVRIDTTYVSKFNIKIDITFLKNTTLSMRQGEITLSRESSRRIIPIVQLRKNRIAKAFALVNAKATFDLQMEDEFLETPTIEKQDNMCISTITSVNLGNKNMQFSDGCVYLLKQMPYKIILKNKGGLDTVEFKATLYDKMIDLNPYKEQVSSLIDLGSNTHLYYTDSENNTIGVININEFKIEKRIVVPDRPKSLVYNPNNKLTYLLGYDEYLRILNLNTGEIVQTVQIPTDPDHDHPQSPYIIPEFLVFNKDGLGFMVTVGNNISGNGFRMINSKDNNSVGLVPYFHWNHVRNIGLQPNNLDFYFNDDIDNNHYTWSATGKTESHLGRMRVLGYKNWALNDEGKLIDYATKNPLGVNIMVYPAFFDRNKELFYGWNTYSSQSYLTQMDAKGNVIGRIPSSENQHQMTLSPDGKYVFLYSNYDADLFRINTAIFNSRIQLTID